MIDVSPFGREAWIAFLQGAGDEKIFRTHVENSGVFLLGKLKFALARKGVKVSQNPRLPMSKLFLKFTSLLNFPLESQSRTLAIRPRIPAINILEGVCLLLNLLLPAYRFQNQLDLV